MPSHKGVPFETVPELKLPEVAEKLQEGLDKGYDFIVTNFANGDVIGHTSSDEAKPKACEAVSRYVGLAVKHAREQGYTVLVTADHGNIEILHTPEGKPHVSHTTNLVACVALGEGTKKLKEHGKLCDVAPTILSAMGIEQPATIPTLSWKPPVRRWVLPRARRATPRPGISTLVPVGWCSRMTCGWTTP